MIKVHDEVVETDKVKPAMQDTHSQKENLLAKYVMNKKGNEEP